VLISNIVDNQSINNIKSVETNQADIRSWCSFYRAYKYCCFYKY